MTLSTLRCRLPTAIEKSSLTKELGLLPLLSTLSGASWGFTRIGVETLPPAAALIAARTLIAGAVLTAIIRRHGSSLRREATGRGRFPLRSCLDSLFPVTLIAWAEQAADAALATLVESRSPTFAFLPTLLVTRHEPVTIFVPPGVVAAIAGAREPLRPLATGPCRRSGLPDAVPANGFEQQWVCVKCVARTNRERARLDRSSEGPCDGGGFPHPPGEAGTCLGCRDA